MKRKPIPQRLRDEMEHSGKSVSQLAGASGVSHPIISRFLSGERDIRLETAEKLAAALNLELEKMQ